MKNIYLIFDETEINGQHQILGCSVIDDENIFSQITEILEKVIFLPGFGSLRNNFPHYTEDSHNQRSMLMDLYNELSFKTYFHIVQKDNEEKKGFRELYLNHLVNISKPIILKYKKIYGENITFNFWFDNIEFLDMSEIDISSFPKGIKIEFRNISKIEENNITSLIDYALGCLYEFLKDNNFKKPESYGKSMFNKISNRVSLIKIVSPTEEKFYYFVTNKEDFIAEYHGKFAKS